MRCDPWLCYACTNEQDTTQKGSHLTIDINRNGKVIVNRNTITIVNRATTMFRKEHIVTVEANDANTMIQITTIIKDKYSFVIFSNSPNDARAVAAFIAENL